MTSRSRDLPRYWPILFVLDCVGTLRNNFHLQKILYLAQVEHNVPISYTFVLEDYGPYSRAVKADFISLASAGLIDLEYGDGWVLKITENGRKVVKGVYAALDEKVLKEFKVCVEKWSRKGLHELKRYVYKEHLPSNEAYFESREDFTELTNALMKHLARYPTSSNKLLVMGALDYVTTALGREQLQDPAQRNHFLRTAVRLIDQVSNIFDETSENHAVLRELMLAQLKDDFDHFQQVSEQYHVLPSLYDENVDLAALIGKPSP